MKQQIIPAESTIRELEEKASECEKRAAQESEPKATELREQAKVYRGWIAALRSGRWTS